MKCPKCENNMECRLSIKTELEERPIYTDYQWWECKSCGKKYFGILEDSKVNIFNDTLEHTGYYANEEDWSRTLHWALKCASPRNAGCKCTIHQQIPPAGFHGDSAW
jgi:hypothetical protein